MDIGRIDCGFRCPRQPRDGAPLSHGTPVCAPLTRTGRPRTPAHRSVRLPSRAGSSSSESNTPVSNAPSSWPPRRFRRSSRGAPPSVHRRPARHTLGARARHGDRRPRRIGRAQRHRRRIHLAPGRTRGGEAETTYQVKHRGSPFGPLDVNKSVVHHDDRNASVSFRKAVVTACRTARAPAPYGGPALRAGPSGRLTRSGRTCRWPRSLRGRRRGHRPLADRAPGAGYLGMRTVSTM